MPARKVFLRWILVAVLLDVFMARASGGNDADGDKAWKNLERTWSAVRLKPMGGKVATRDLPKIADAARSFYTQYPAHPKVGEAHELEDEVLASAWYFGATNLTQRLVQLEHERFADPNLKAHERFLLRRGQVDRLMRGSLDEFEKAALDLQKDFPNEDIVYYQLARVLDRCGIDRSQKLAEQLLSGPMPDSREAGILKRRLERIGKPIDLKFTAAEGKQVDAAKMHGKVVIVQFWSTTCVPCVLEMPTIKALFDKYHGQGLELVGVNLDIDPAKARRFVRDKKLEWPQHYRDKGDSNDFSKEVEVMGIPAFLLVDKQGKVRSWNAEDSEDFEGQIIKLLGEN
jgi:thiol-disulfide isomerase/thioredoxin